MVALLRGVNVGGRSKLAMTDLRAVATGLGYRDVATYIQSGNLVLSASKAPAVVAEELGSGIAAATATSPTVLVRTAAELAAVVDANPYRRRGEDEAHLHVVFTDGAAEAGMAALDLSAYTPEEATAIGRELHLFLPDGVGRSKLAADVSRSRATVGTMRNWRTVAKLLDMATAIEA